MRMVAARGLRYAIRSCLFAALMQISTTCDHAAAQDKIPQDAWRFVKWCSERGVTTKDSMQWTCYNWISSMACVTAAAIESKPSHPFKCNFYNRCTNIGNFLLPTESSEAETTRSDSVAQPVYEWIRDNLEILLRDPRKKGAKVNSLSIGAAVQTAVLTLHCKESAQPQKRR